MKPIMPELAEKSNKKKYPYRRCFYVICICTEKQQDEVKKAISLILF